MFVTNRPQYNTQPSTPGLKPSQKAYAPSGSIQRLKQNGHKIRLKGLQLFLERMKLVLSLLAAALVTAMIAVIANVQARRNSSAATIQDTIPTTTDKQTVIPEKRVTVQPKGEGKGMSPLVVAQSTASEQPISEPPPEQDRSAGVEPLPGQDASAEVPPASASHGRTPPQNKVEQRIEALYDAEPKALEKVQRDFCSDPIAYRALIRSRNAATRTDARTQTLRRLVDDPSRLDTAFRVIIAAYTDEPKTLPTPEEVDDIVDISKAYLDRRDFVSYPDSVEDIRESLMAATTPLDFADAIRKHFSPETAAFLSFISENLKSSGLFKFSQPPAIPKDGPVPDLHTVVPPGAKANISPDSMLEDSDRNAIQQALNSGDAFHHMPDSWRKEYATLLKNPKTTYLQAYKGIEEAQAQIYAEAGYIPGNRDALSARILPEIFPRRQKLDTLLNSPNFQRALQTVNTTMGTKSVLFNEKKYSETYINAWKRVWGPQYEGASKRSTALPEFTLGQLQTLEELKKLFRTMNLFRAEHGRDVTTFWLLKKSASEEDIKLLRNYPYWSQDEAAWPPEQSTRDAIAEYLGKVDTCVKVMKAAVANAEQATSNEHVFSQYQQFASATFTIAPLERIAEDAANVKRIYENIEVLLQEVKKNP